MAHYDQHAGKYGHTLHVWNWEKHTPVQDIDLGTSDGMIPLELRFLHNPDEAQGYVGVALSSNVFHFFKSEVCVQLLQFDIRITIFSFAS